MKVLITGAAGYLGHRLVVGLESNHDLTLTDLSTATGFGLGNHQWHESDVSNFHAVSDLVAGHDAVIHTVALVRGRVGLPIERFVDVVIKGTWNVAEASAHAEVHRLINRSWLCLRQHLADPLSKRLEGRYGREIGSARLGCQSGIGPGAQH